MMQESKLTNFQQRQLSANMKGLSVFRFFVSVLYVCVCMCVDSLKSVWTRVFKGLVDENQG